MNLNGSDGDSSNNLNNRPYLIARTKFAIALIIVILCIPLFFFPGFKSKEINKPYIILYETITKEDAEKCIQDSNCMDIMPMNVLSENEN